MKLAYKLVPKGAGNGVVPLSLAFIDKKDIDSVGVSYREACQMVANNHKEDAISINVIDCDAITVTSDGIIADGAVVAFASADRGKINKDFGYMTVSEIPYSEKTIAEEPHMKQWNTPFYRGRRLHRGPNAEDRKPLESHNENMTMTGRMTNNNTGSEMMNVVDMTEILVPFFGQTEIIKDGNLLLGLAGPVISVGIGMIVRERQGRIFGWNYGAGKTAHNSGEFAKTVKSDYPALAADKKVLAEYILRALDINMVPGRDIGCSPAVLSLAKAYGKPIAFDNIEESAWVELESVGFSREKLEAPSKVMSRDEIIANADEIIPGMEDGIKYKASELVEKRFAEK
ncbi:hypothetical protein [Fusibacter ferrireducens]|uniref:Uncharacterized protein n=1 Tax=Fusibacter ferrireducens TaxID=2785058 RepID=A0ABR9ZU27_9FIRM|nr:hypothetical protein [Fusibacter ferrireducens]MBF4693938.1 hypothetical protein [Fusibacter ferrireducens]